MMMVMAVRRGRKMKLRMRRKKGRLKELSTPDLDRGNLLIIAPPFASYTSLCGMLWQTTKEKGQQRK
jgi:hypothetical protein